MSNKFKAALAATSFAGAMLVTGAEVDVNGFEVDIVQNQAVAAIVSDAVATAKPVEPFIVIAGMVGRDSNGSGGDGRGDGNNSKSGGGGGGGHY